MMATVCQKTLVTVDGDRGWDLRCAEYTTAEQIRRHTSSYSAQWDVKKSPRGQLAATRSKRQRYLTAVRTGIARKLDLGGLVWFKLTV